MGTQTGVGGVQIQKGSKKSFYGHGEDYTNLSAIKFQRAMHAHTHTYKETQIFKNMVKTA